ncbi:MAG: efflux RND transporter periplasmic adaptor subunit [Planctomycetota bacterium]
MTDLSKLRTPAWRRVVEELSSDAANATAFLTRLCGVLARVANARQGAIVLVAPDTETGGDEASIPYAVAVASAGGRPPEAAPIDPARVEHGSWMRAAATEAQKTGDARVFSLAEDDDGIYSAGGQAAAVLACPVDLKFEDGKRATICITVEQRSREAIQTTMALMELLCGYARLHVARQDARGAWQASAALDLAGRLIASINEADGFKGACLQMVNDLARAAGADRAALGWVKGLGDSGVVRVVALSDTEHVDRRLKMVRMIEAAMEECFDQEHAVVYPLPKAPPSVDGSEPDADPVLAAAITHAHRELSSSDARMRVGSLPIRSGENVVGVATLEVTDGVEVNPARLELLQATLDLVGPVIELRRSDDRPLPVRAWHSTLRTAAWVLTPKHTAWKLAAVVALVILLAITFIKIPYRIDAQAELVAVDERVVAAPYAGIIFEVPEGIKPGAQVSAGDVLLRLDTTELQESQLDAQSRMSAALREADEARKENDLNAATQAEARAEQAAASLRYVNLQIERAVVRAPIDGTIISGDARRRVGSAAELGEPIYRIASLDQLEVVARVEDRDIGYVTAESVGGFATRARPGERFELQGQTLVPLGRPDEGANVFELRGVLVDPPGWLRPGMEGIAYFDTENKRIVWVLSRRLIDTVRLWLWY